MVGTQKPRCGRPSILAVTFIFRCFSPCYLHTKFQFHGNLTPNPTVLKKGHNFTPKSFLLLKWSQKIPGPKDPPSCLKVCCLKVPTTKTVTFTVSKSSCETPCFLPHGCDGAPSTCWASWASEISRFFVMKSSPVVCWIFTEVFFVQKKQLQGFKAKHRIG